MDIFVAGFTDGGGQRFAADSRNGGLAGRVDVGQDEHIGLIKGQTEVVPQMLRARVTMRLEEHQKTVELATASGFERGPYLGGMVAIVVNHGDVIDRTLDVEATADPAEIRESLANQLSGNIQIERDG